MKLLTFHKDILVKVQEMNPAVINLVSEAISKLEEEGKDEFIKHVDSL